LDDVIQKKLNLPQLCCHPQKTKILNFPVLFNLIYNTSRISGGFAQLSSSIAWRGVLWCKPAQILQKCGGPWTSGLNEIPRLGCPTESSRWPLWTIIQSRLCTQRFELVSRAPGFHSGRRGRWLLFI